MSEQTPKVDLVIEEARIKYPDDCEAFFEEFYSTLPDVARSLELECARLTQEKAVLVKDAERYRWLRLKQYAESETDFVMVNGYGDLTGDKLDTAIDAALAKVQP